KHLYKPFDPKHIQVSSLKFIKDLQAVEFQIDSVKFEYTLATGQLTLVDTVRREERGERGITWGSFSPDSTLIVFSRNFNLYVMRANDPDSTEYQLTTEGIRDYSFGSGPGRDDEDDEEEVNRRRRASVSWFKDSHKFYMTRSDQRNVKDLWVINSVARPRPTLRTYKYTFPGEKDQDLSEMWVFNAESRTKVRLDADKWPEQSFFGTYTTSNDNMLYFARTSRDHKNMDFCSADTETGEVTVLFSEQSEPYFNFRSRISLNVLNDGEDLLYKSDRDGWMHYYLYGPDGTLKSQVTSGTFIAERSVKIDTTGRQLYFSAAGAVPGTNPYHTHHFRVNFDGTGMTLLDPDDGSHSISISESNKYIVDNFSSADMIPQSVVRDANGNKIMDLETMDLSRLEEAGWQMPESFTVKAADGVTDLYGVIYKPFDFDPNKKYPIIDYVYPGPQQEGPRFSFSAASSNSTLAQLGFIVVTVGNRGGSPRRSKFYQTYGYWDARDYGLEDQKFAIEQLADRYDFIDINKVGIHGHSGGGFMSTAAMLVYPDFFKVAVSSAGNHDNNIYHQTWGEFYFGIKMVKKKARGNSDSEGAQDEEEYEIEWETNIDANHELAKNLKGKLLLVHGDYDNNVHPSNTMRMVEALIKEGKRFDFMIMPGKAHSFGDMGTYFNKMKADYFAEHLLGSSNKDIDIYNINK
ncbi:DPP IV N-terminal domain-containing protein, partial [candidate division KSB1 bacterium]